VNKAFWNNKTLRKTAQQFVLNTSITKLQMLVFHF